MIEDVYEPLAQYRDVFRDAFSVRTRKAFEALVQKSGVDVEANRVLVARVRALERRAEAARGRAGAYGLGIAVTCVVAVAAGVGLYVQDCIVTMVWPYCLGALAVVVPLIWWLWSRRREVKTLLARLEASVDELRKQAWEQMEPLNRLYTWELPARLVAATVPRLAFDPYFTARRLVDLRRLCGWDDAFSEGKSIVGVQSGVINGNPFVFGDYLDQTWGEKTYTGSIQISWLEEEEDEKGRVRLVRRRETLSASVTKPIPVYGRHKFVVYGNDAAPNLSFTRSPSELSGEGDGLLARWRKRRELRKLEKFSRNLEDASQFTLMANHEFETLFQTPDRNHEVEYRLLFTALAQTQMLLLLKDRTVGFGDDFSFMKRKKINLLRSHHLDAAVMDTDPARFRNWDLEEARKTFQVFNEAFFKDVYFSLAPILAIPLYQQTRPHAEIWRGVAPDDEPNFWEFESLANYYGDAQFKHPSCVTECLLKTQVLGQEEDATRVAVTALGYRIEKRVDYETAYGGDGNLHEIPVEWDEYLPVEQTREMVVSVRPTPTETFQKMFESADKCVFRRLIRSYL